MAIASLNVPELDAGLYLLFSLSFVSLSLTYLSVVSFYGVPDLTKLNLKKIRVPVQGHFGNLDEIKGFSDVQVHLDHPMLGSLTDQNRLQIAWKRP